MASQNLHSVNKWRYKMYGIMSLVQETSSYAINM